MSNRLNSPASLRRHRRHLVTSIIVVALIALFYFAPNLREQEPNYYEPGRSALVNARLHFKESLPHEQAFIEQQQKAHEQMELAIAYLLEAEGLDLTDRKRIEALRLNLLALKNTDQTQAMTPQVLQQTYRDILEQLDALISKLENLD